MSGETIIKFILCAIGVVITIYNYFLIGRKTKRSKTTNSLELCCVMQFIISLILMLALLTQKYEFHKYFNYISLEVILMSLCIQIVFWLSWFKVFRMQFAHIYSDVLFTTLNGISLLLYIITSVITFIAFFDDGKFFGMRSDYAITVLVLWFSLLELVISISTFILNYRKHQSWVKLRDQQLQKLASINPSPIRMIGQDRLGNFNNNINHSISGSEELVVKSNTKLESSQGDINSKTNSIIITVGSASGSKQDIQKPYKSSQDRLNNEYLKMKIEAPESNSSLNGSIMGIKKSCLSYECIDKTILHYMHDKSVDFANSDPRATENNIKLICILHTILYTFHTVISILIMVILLVNWKYSLQLLLLYTQIEITLKLQDHFLLRQFVDLSLT
ncbi:hypothetical protein U3516DRAFT_585504 [Neocallimastix sp. 'constans']